MDKDEKPKRKGGGLEFIPLREGHIEADYEVPHGKVHPGQLSMFEGAEVRVGRGRRARK